MEFLATAAFGLEGLVKRELQEMGLDARADNGCVRFSGSLEDAMHANLRLRCADRVLLLVSEKKVTTFEELFQQVKSIPWEDLLPENARIPVTGKCARSTLMSVRDCQAVGKKAIVERMKKAYRRDLLPENGREYKVDIALHGDICRVTLDTSGDALNRRGYRTWNGEAPLRETLAAALVMLSPWYSAFRRAEKAGSALPLLHDPCCGTGTLLIEAAFIMSHRAPGLSRHFAMEDWQQTDPAAMRRLRSEAENEYRPENIRGISGGDIDPEALKLCKKHIVQAGLGGRITVSLQDLREGTVPVLFAEAEEEAIRCLLCNPPYGERMSDRKNCEKLYRDLGKLRTACGQGTRLCMITAYTGAEKHVQARPAYKRRLYNGRLECEYTVF